jgi:hypothetical protein
VDLLASLTLREILDQFVRAHFRPLYGRHLHGPHGFAFTVFTVTPGAIGLKKRCAILGGPQGQGGCHKHD